MEGALELLNDVKAVALDFDGVLTDLIMDYEALRRKASEIAGECVRSLNDFFNKAFGSRKFWEVNELVKEAELEAVRESSLKPGVKGFLQALRRRGIRVYLTTMQSAEPVNYFLSKEGLTNYFKEVLTRESYRSKREMYLRVLSLEGLRPKEVAVIDDSWRNIRICEELGMLCVKVERALKTHLSTPSEKL